jgi:tellurite resistance protein TerC
MTPIVWLAFFSIYIGLLALDLVVLHREARVLHVRQALGWTVVWIVVALSFGGLVYGVYEYNWFGWTNGDGIVSGRDAVIQYVTGYLLEWSLSVDNIFVMALIFSYMKIPAALQYRVLFWGIVGAIALRGAMIALGSALIHSFDWMFYVFGGILLVSAARMLRSGDEDFDPGKSMLMRLARKLYPVTDQLDGENFFARVGGQLSATPLFVTLLFIDFADVVFAVDSIPAIFAVTQDSFLVFTSNAFAILGLRSLYFAIAGLMVMFRYLKISLVFILAFIAIKLILMHHIQIPNILSLAVIVGMLGIGILASIMTRPKDSVGP